jgi:exodeoxyribonuclease VII large subunit
VTGGPVDVADLLAHVAHLLDRGGLTEITLTGRLSGWRRTRAWGQADLTTPTPDGTDFSARIPIGVPGRAAAALEARLERTHPGALAGDPTVTVTGAVEIHPRYGPMRFIVRSLSIDHDATSRSARARERDLARLVADGVFTRQRTLALPERVTTIGVLTGGGTAARADFRDRIARLPDHYQLQEFEVPTAGPGAPTAMAGGLTLLDRRGLDCIAVIRGGGPAVDLRAFDHPDLASVVGRCGTPVLTGVGHATDVTLVDRASHRALPTPSAVADYIGRHNAQQALVAANQVAAAAGRQLALQRTKTTDAQARLRVAVTISAVLLVVVIALVVTAAL